MAPIHGHLTYQMTDYNKVPWPLDIPLNVTSGLLADVESFVLGFTPLLDAVSDNQITNITFALPVAVPGGTKAAPTTGTNGSPGALLQYLDNQQFPNGETFWVPGWKQAGYDPAHPALVIQSGVNAYTAFLAGMLAAIGPAQIVTEDLTNLAILRRAVKSERKKRRALGRLR